MLTVQAIIENEPDNSKLADTLHLSVVLDHSVEEIADLLGISQETAVKTRMG